MGLFFQTEVFRGSLKVYYEFSSCDTSEITLGGNQAFVDFSYKTLIKFHFTFCVGFETPVRIAFGTERAVNSLKK